MKLNTRTRATFAGVLLLSLLIGTLTWEVIERIVTGLGLVLDLSIGPIGFDAHVIAVWIRVNPGTVIAVYPAVKAFQSL